MNIKILFLFISLSITLLAQPTNNFLTFDAIDDFVKIQNDTSMFPDNNVTFEGWFNTNNASNGQPILDYNNGIHFWINVGEPWFGSGANLLDVSNGFHIITFNPYVSAANWNHLAVTYNGSTGEAIVYLNGELKNSQNLGFFTLSAAANISIGHREDGNIYYFNGGLCEIRLWNVVRSNAQILETMNVQLNEPYLLSADSGLVGYWKLDMLEDLGIGTDGADDIRDHSYKQNHGDSYGVPAILTGVTNDTENIVEQFKLEQNYPNPFNPATMITYHIPNSSNVELKIFNTLGKEVATLVNEIKPAGVYNVQFTINNLQLGSGIYFYQLKAGEFIQTKKMILVK